MKPDPTRYVLKMDNGRYWGYYNIVRNPYLATIYVPEWRNPDFIKAYHANPTWELEEL